MLLKDMCTAEVVCCTSDTSVLEAARLMRHKHVGDLVVVDDPDDERTGIVTDRDLVVEVLANELDPLKTTLASVIDRMRTRGVRRIPVVDNDGRLVGIATLNDLLDGVGDARALLDAMVKGRTREQHLRC